LLSPTLYEWFDANNNNFGNNAVALQQVRAGVYRLKVTDARTCVIESSPFKIEDVSTQMPAPIYPDITISRYTTATLVVKNYVKGDYKLFGDASGLPGIEQNNTGTFTIKNVEKDKTVYIQQNNGSCVSPLVPVAIKVVDKSYFTIPNAFTPNHDQLNDRLPVRIHGAISLTYFRIYNRWGNIVFETTRLNDSWDGTSNGLQQLSGTYVWVAEGKDINGVTIRDKGNVVLIR
jgi:gliding motility-associated-like protein